MSLEEKKEIIANQIVHLMSLTENFERDNYIDPEQYYEAQKTIEVLIEQLLILKYNLIYVGYSYLAT